MNLFPVLLVIAAAAADQPNAVEIHPRPPQLSAAFPPGSEPGKSLQVEVLGQSLDRVSEVVFSDSSIRGKVIPGSHGRLTLAFEISREAAFGPHYFRVVSPRGTSNPLLFRVGDLPHVLEKEPNTGFGEAQLVTVPVTIQGQLNVDGDSDFFRFHAEKGQTLVFDVRAARNGNGLDAGLILLDSRGRKLQHDEDHFVWDPFFAHTFAAAGDYTVVIQPTHVRNDPTFAYQLDIRTAPHIETLDPIAVAPGVEIEATLYGAGFTESDVPLWFDAPGFSGTIVEARGDSARAKIRVPSNARPGVRELAVVTPRGRSSHGQLMVDATPVHRGGESIAPPVSIAGVARYREAERFTFNAEAGQKLLFEVRAMRLGSWVDATLRILDESGKQVAYNDDGNFPGVQFNKDPQLLHTFDKAGKYSVEIRNLWKIGGENHPYQLVVREPQPSAEVMLASDTVSLPANGTAALKLTAVRREGFADAIPVSVEGLPEGVKMEATEIAAGKNEGEIRFRAGDLPVGKHSRFRVLAAGEPAWRSARIASGGGEGATFGIAREVTLVIAEPAHYSLEAAASSLNLVRGGTVMVVVKVKRVSGFAEPIHFTFEGLPAGLKAEEAVCAGDASDVTLTLHASADAEAGRIPRVIILGQSASGESQEAPRISLVVD